MIAPKHCISAARLMVFLALGGGTAYAGYMFTTIDDPNAQFYPATFANAVNNSGQIVGSYSTAEFTSTGFLYNSGSFSDVTDTNFQFGSHTNSTFPNGINSSGVIVGSYNNFFGNRGFEYNAGTFTDITVAGSFGTYATGINDSGQIVGYSYNGTIDNGFLDASGVFSTISDPNAGSSFGQGTFPWDINNSGVIVGYYIDSNNIVHGFIDQNGVFTTLDDPQAGQTAGEGTYVLGINNLGQVSGYYVVQGTGQDLGLDYHGFVYSNGAFTQVDDPDALATGGTEVYKINDSGQLVGNYTCTTCGDNYQGFLATLNNSGGSATPEPSTWALLLLGLVMVKFFDHVHGCRRRSGQARPGGD